MEKVLGGDVLLIYVETGATAGATADSETLITEIRSGRWIENLITTYLEQQQTVRYGLQRSDQEDR